MSSDICMGEQFVWVSNMELHRLIAFALEIAPARAETPEHRDFIVRLREFYDEQYFPGCSFDLIERFPTIQERKFWAGCFHDVARRIFLRELGSHDISFWQSATIGDAYIIVPKPQPTMAD